MPQSALLGAFLAGLLGGLHCVAMCGGWIAVVAHTPASTPLLPASTLRAGQALSQLGRIATYVILGAAFGAAGGAMFAQAVAPVQRGLYLAANVMLLLLAVSLAVRTAQFDWLERAGLRVF